MRGHRSVRGGVGGSAKFNSMLEKNNFFGSSGPETTNKGDLAGESTGAALSLLNTQPVMTRRNQSQGGDREKTVKMNAKVLETWINETLQDAEHLDIPGVILKPEHKPPIQRYGIARILLTQNRIPNEFVDRIYRALFVYSVGFYELIKK